jgi:hypothetical protein
MVYAVYFPRDSKINPEMDIILNSTISKSFMMACPMLFGNIALDMYTNNWDYIMLVPYLSFLLSIIEFRKSK